MSEVVNSVFDPGLFALCCFWLGGIAYGIKRDVRGFFFLPRSMLT